MTAVITVTAWTPMARNSLVGFANVALPSGLILIDVTIHCQHDRIWASPPAKPQVSSGVLVMLDGKIQYTAVISFADKATRDRWSGALRHAFPDTLDMEA